MKVRIRYLSGIREQVGRREDELEFPQGSRLQTVADWLAANRGLSVPGPRLMATLNGHGWSQLPDALAAGLNDGDEIALFPLVSGG